MRTLTNLVCLAGLAATPGAARASGNLSVLYEFSGAASDGAHPAAGLLAGPGGVFYGTTQGYYPGDSSSAALGSVFELSPPTKTGKTWKLRTLHRFPQLGELVGTLAADASGALYGVASISTGVAPKQAIEYGAVYRLAPPPPGVTDWTFSELYRFTAGADGADPLAGVVVVDGALYGTTSFSNYFPSGSGPAGPGTVFRLAPPGPGQTSWQFSVLANLPLTCQSGVLIARSIGGVLNLFGMCGGYQTTLVYNITAPKAPAQAWTYSTIATLSGGLLLDGLQPGLVADNSLNLYGVTEGNNNSAGSVVKISPPVPGHTSWIASTLAVSDPLSLIAPTGSLAQLDGKLYGLSGTTLFSLTPRDYGGHLLPWNYAERFRLPYSPGQGPFPGGTADLVTHADSPTTVSFYGTSSLSGVGGTVSNGFAGYGLIYRLQLPR